jgi:hypothetical protein
MTICPNPVERPLAVVSYEDPLVSCPRSTL